MKTAVITGITGQTGSYLAEMLLDKGYKVYGLRRRCSVFNTERIDHVLDDPHVDDRVELVYGDLADYSSLSSLVSDVKPDLFFNMAAQSHVRVSFEIPVYTFDIDSTGVIRCLEALKRHSPHTHFVQSSTSELYGSTPAPQNEETPFHPRSPYAAAKIGGYWATVNYREAYDMHASNSVSFNHECIAENTPILVKRDGFVTVCSASELIPLKRKGKNVQTYDLIGKGFEIWDGHNWVQLKTITATKRDKKNHDHNVRWTEARGGVVLTTNHHTMLEHTPNTKDGYTEKRADLLREGGDIYLRHLPGKMECFDKQLNGSVIITKELAELLGMLASDGCVKESHIQFTNNDQSLIDKVNQLWASCFMGYTSTRNSASGFNKSKTVKQTNLCGRNSIISWLREQLYTYRKFKKVPDVVLNASLEVQKAFISGYYAGDGLKAGNSESIKTNSPFLAQGLCFLYSSCYDKFCSVYVEHRNEKTYYQLNVHQNKGHHLSKNPNEIRKVGEHSAGSEYSDAWVFDLETESGLFMAGVGRVVVHNSPRRGGTFVTKKITQAAARIKHGLQEKLYLGNLDAKRDWSHAKDVARAQYMIATADSSDDFCIGSGESHSVKEFLNLVFDKVGLSVDDHVEFDERYLRPSEVDHLESDPSKIKEALGWEPEYSFDNLVEEMVEYDLELARKEKLLKDNE